MNLHEMAFQIYLKKLPSSYCTEQTKKNFTTMAQQAYAMAEVFYQEMRLQPSSPPLPDNSNEEIPF